MFGGALARVYQAHIPRHRYRSASTAKVQRHSVAQSKIFGPITLADRRDVAGSYSVHRFLVRDYLDSESGHLAPLPPSLKDSVAVGVEPAVPGQGWPPLCPTATAHRGLSTHYEKHDHHSLRGAVPEVHVRPSKYRISFGSSWSGYQPGARPARCGSRPSAAHCGVWS